MNRLSSLTSCALALATVLFLTAGQASAALVNAALGGKNAIQSSTLANPANPIAAKAVDGSTNGNFPSGSVTHTLDTSTTPSWRVDLGAAMKVSSVTMFNRTDCCAGRLSDIFVNFYAADGTTLVASSPELNNNNGGANNQNVGPATLGFNLNAPTLARYVEVVRNNSTATGDPASDNVLSLAEVPVFADNIALGKPASQTSTLGGFTASLATDGNLGNFTHTLNTDTSPMLTVDLQGAFVIDSVVLHNRDDCCSGRLRDITVQVLDANNQVVATSPLQNPGNVLGGGLGVYNTGGNGNPLFLALDFHQMFGGPVLGNFVKISRTVETSGTGDDQRVLALGEVQVFGAEQIVPEPATALLSLGMFAALAIRRRRAA